MRTHELERRPARTPDHEAEILAVQRLADRMGSDPGTVLTALAQTVVELGGVGSAAVSIRERGRDGRPARIRWAAAAGELASCVGLELPEMDVPCGLALRLDRPLLLDRPARHFRCLEILPRPVHEVLVVPFHVEGKPVGTLFAMTHAGDALFDREDLRLLATLSLFASAGYRLTRSLREALAAKEDLERRVEERTSALADELGDIVHLQEASVRLIPEGNVRVLYEEILSTVISLLRAQRGTLQLHDEGSQALETIASHGFEPGALDRFARIHAEDMNTSARALRERRRVIVGRIEGSWLAATPMGRMLQEAGLAAAHSTPLITRSGRVLGMFSTYWTQPCQPSQRQLQLVDILARQVADLMERHRVEEDLRAGERRYRALAELSPNGILVEVGGRVVYANRSLAELLGAASVEELLDSDLLQLAGSEDSRRVWEPGPGSRLSHAVETRWRRQDGLWVDVEISSSLIGWEGREAVQCIVRDITTSKRLEREREDYLECEATARRAAEQASRAKDEFLAMLGHELRNPLAPIVTALQVMRMDGRESREQDILERQVAHLTRLVDDLLDVSRITRGKIELARKRVELCEVLDRAVEIASPLLEQRRHRVEINVPRGGLQVHVDTQRMAQVLSNLLTNAAKYSDPGSRISVRARRSEDGISVSVLDQGVGIASEQLQRIFEPFVQQAQSLDRARGGLGLGLAIVRSLVEQHGGRVYAHSDGPGLGSEFVIDLPAVDSVEAAERPVRDADGQPCAGAGAGCRVLIVDDNHDGATMLRFALEATGHEVMVALDGPSALVMARRFAPEIALLDIGLPVMDGYELARRLQEQHGPGLRMLAVTGYGQEEDRQRCLDAGFEEHLVKPVDLDRLEQVIRRDSSPVAG